MAKLTVLSAGAVRTALGELTAAFARDRGLELDLAFAPAPELRDRLRGGTGAVDVIAAPKALMDEFEAGGLIAPETRAALGGVKAAVAVHAGAPEPDISSPEAVKAAVLVAGAIVYNTASSGQYIDRMLEKLGVMEAIAGRITRFPTAEDAMAFLGDDDGRGAIGFGQSSAIRGYEAAHNVRQVGPLPDEIGNVTDYAVAAAAGAPDPALARDLVAYLVSDAGLAAFRATGVE